MLKMRLQRTGRRNNPFFRVIVTDSRSGPKSGKYIEKLGYYDPKAGEIEINADRAKHWLSVGAQTSGTVHNFLINKGIIEGKKINVLPKKSPIVAKVEEAKADLPAQAGEIPSEGGEEASETEDMNKKAKAEETSAEDLKKEEKSAEELKEDEKAEKAPAKEDKK